MAVDAESLFAKEAALREAAVVYTSWEKNGDGGKDADRKGRDNARKVLRAAAVAYANAANELDK